MEKRANFLGRAQLHGFVTQLQSGGYTDSEGKHQDFTPEQIKSAAAAYPLQMQKRAKNAERIREQILASKTEEAA